ncbi:MAG: MFS transporter [Candidatus Lokiarchaeota archaeon]|nr:MFS transporter [Candidatus Lokiarchaeota archaeon]
MKNSDESVEELSKKNSVPMKLKLGYSIGEITDMIAYQGFWFLTFPFYASILKINLDYITIAFIIWSIFNAFNDPILGTLSDKTKTSHLGGGRRRPWMVAMLVPLSVVMFFLFLPTGNSEILATVYMCLIMCLFDTFYTAYSINHTSLYPEMFQTNREREEVGASRRIIMIVGLLIAFVLPTFFIDELIVDTDSSISQYRITGIVMGILIFITMLIHLIYGVKEPPIEHIKEVNTLSFIESLKTSLKNKKFLILVMGSTMCWYIFTLLPIVIEIYVAGVWNRTDTGSTTLLLLITFLSSAIGVLMWQKVDSKVGSRKGLIYTMIWWGISFILMFFAPNYESLIFFMILVGIGLGGAPYFIDRNISNITDEDELNTNCRREASYYGVHAIFIRLAAILVILSINIVFSYRGFEEIDVSILDEDDVFGIKFLTTILPAIAMGIGLIFMKFFKLGREEVKEIQKKRKEICKD